VRYQCRSSFWADRLLPLAFSSNIPRERRGEPGQRPSGKGGTKRPPFIWGAQLIVGPTNAVMLSGPPVSRRTHYRWHALCGRHVRLQNIEYRSMGEVVHVEVMPGVVFSSSRRRLQRVNPSGAGEKRSFGDHIKRLAGAE
jgi:hypothetical protein